MMTVVRARRYKRKSCNTGNPIGVVSIKKCAVINCAKATINRLMGLLILKSPLTDSVRSIIMPSGIKIDKSLREKVVTPDLIRKIVSVTFEASLFSISYLENLSMKTH